MTTSYTYNITTDFTNATQINLTQLQKEIDVSISIKSSYINQYNDNIIIFFQSSLDGTQKTSLDVLVSTYTYIEHKHESLSIANQVVVSNDPNNPGDYTSISAAFNSGESSVLVRNGIYVESSDINIPNGGQLKGELPGKTYIILYGPYSVKIDGSGGILEVTGTLSISNNTKVVTGVGTTFTNLLSGYYILLGTNFYQIDTVDSDIQVTLKDIYVGITITGINVKAQPMYTGCAIENIIISSSTTVGIYCRAMRHGCIKSVAITNCAQTCTINNCSDLSITQIICTLSGGVGMKIIDCVSISSSIVNIFNSIGNGIEISGLNLIFESCAFENNNGVGFHILDNSQFVNLTDCVIKNNNNTGLLGEVNTSFISVSNSEFSNNNGKGISLIGYNNSISNNFVTLNKSNAITVGLDNNIHGNSIKNNIGDGIVAPVGSDYTLIVNNDLNNNTGIGINLLCFKSITSNNVIQNSGGDGIYLNSINNIINNNIISGSGGNGLYIDSGSSGSVITGNIIETSDGNGLEIITGINKCIISSNNLEDNTGTNYIDGGTGTVSANNII
jgi:hypothetical protein